MSSILWRHYNFSQNGDRVKTVFFFIKTSHIQNRYPFKKDDLFGYKLTWTRNYEMEAKWTCLNEQYVQFVLFRNSDEVHIKLNLYFSTEVIFELRPFCLKRNCVSFSIIGITVCTVMLYIEPVQTGIFPEKTVPSELLITLFFAYVRHTASLTKHHATGGCLNAIGWCGFGKKDVCIDFYKTLGEIIMRKKSETISPHRYVHFYVRLVCFIIQKDKRTVSFLYFTGCLIWEYGSVPLL